MILSEINAQSSFGATLPVIHTGAIRVDVHEALFIHFKVITTYFLRSGVMVVGGASL